MACQKGEFVMSIDEPTTMGNVFDGVIEHLIKQGYSQSAYAKYKTALYRMQNYLGTSLTPYSTDKIERFRKDLSEKYENGVVSKDIWYPTRRVICMADEFFATGDITLGSKKVTCTSKYVVSDSSTRLVDDYGISLRQRNYRKRTIDKCKYDAKLFMYYLESIGVDDIGKIDNTTVAKFIPFVSSIRKATVGDAVYNVRHFLLFLHDQGLINERVPEALHIYISRPKKIRYGFSNDEVNAILDSVDRSTDIGKRDYAILILAAHTALRSVDIRQLKLNDIKWEQAEIHIVQSKTQKPLILPLLEVVGDAISEYILNVRPKLKDKPIFLTIKHPYSGLECLDDIVEKYAKISGVAESTKAPLTIHSFRRGLGVSMLKADVPLSEILEVLGHTRQTSANKYLAVDVDNLRICATPMGLFVPKEDES